MSSKICLNENFVTCLVFRDGEFVERLDYNSHERCEHFTHFGENGTVAALSQCKGRNNNGKFIRGFVSTGDFAFDIYQEPGSASAVNKNEQDYSLDHVIPVQISRVSNLPDFNHSSFIHPKSSASILKEFQDEKHSKRLATSILKLIRL